jgi:hypothetical protein
MVESTKREYACHKLSSAWGDSCSDYDITFSGSFHDVSRFSKRITSRIFVKATSAPEGVSAA